MRKPAPGQHNYQLLECAANKHKGMWYFVCRRCGVHSQCYSSRRLAKVAADNYHTGGKPVYGFSHSATE